MEPVVFEVLPGGVPERRTPCDQIRLIVELTGAIEQAVAQGRTAAAMDALTSLREQLQHHFRQQERDMQRLGRSHDIDAHCREHEALLGGLGAIHCAIVSENLSRLSHQVGAYVQRVARHVVEKDVPFSEDLVAA